MLDRERRFMRSGSATVATAMSLYTPAMVSDTVDKERERRKDEEKEREGLRRRERRMRRKRGKDYEEEREG